MPTGETSYLVSSTVQVTEEALANRTFPDEAAAGDTEARTGTDTMDNEQQVTLAHHGDVSRGCRFSLRHGSCCLLLCFRERPRRTPTRLSKRRRTPKRRSRSTSCASNSPTSTRTRLSSPVCRCRFPQPRVPGTAAAVRRRRGQAQRGDHDPHVRHRRPIGCQRRRVDERNDHATRRLQRHAHSRPCGQRRPGRRHHRSTVRRAQGLYAIPVSVTVAG